MSAKDTPSAGAKALKLIKRIRNTPSGFAREELCDELIVVLIESDFREWKRDPSLRSQRKSAKKAAPRKAAKRAKVAK